MDIKKTIIKFNSMSLKNEAKRAHFNPLNDAEKEYILKHYKDNTVPKMCKFLKRGVKIIYNFLDENNLHSYNPNTQGVKRVPKNKENFDETKFQNWIVH